MTKHIDNLIYEEVQLREGVSTTGVDKDTGDSWTSTVYNGPIRATLVCRRCHGEFLNRSQAAGHICMPQGLANAYSIFCGWNARATRHEQFERLTQLFAKLADAELRKPTDDE